MTQTDLIPHNTTFKLNGKEYEIEPYSLYTKIHFFNKYGVEKYKQMLDADNQEIILSEVAYFLLVDKTDFPTLESFQKTLITREAQYKVSIAVLEAIGFASKFPGTPEEAELFIPEEDPDSKKK